MPRTSPPRPGAVAAARVLPLPPGEAFALVTDARRHGDWIPLTRVEADWPPRVGARVRAVTGPGANRGGPGLVDVLRVTRWDPPREGRPGVAHYLREGPLLHGWAHIVVRAEGAGALVVWAELGAPAGPLPRDLGARLLAPAIRAVVRGALAGAARDARR